MKPLSGQLSELSDRAKKAEDVVAAAQSKNRAELERQRDRLESTIKQGRAAAEAAATTTQNKVLSWWDETRSAVDGQFASLRDKADEHRAARDLKQAQRRADDAEQDAADAVEFAVNVLVQAEYAVVDAALARADADALAQPG
jgi:flagellar biosynthesis chaperone FliJ